MIISLAALAHVEGNVSFAAGWWPLVTKWAEYLEKFGFDPGSQLCTDDFAGHLAHNANLAVKSIVALACYARLAEGVGDAAAAQKYARLARGMVPKWMEAAKGGRAGGYRLAYDVADSWSMKYNLAWDRVLGLGLFPPDVAEAEMKAYRALLQPFGLPLDTILGMGSAINPAVKDLTSFVVLMVAPINIIKGVGISSSSTSSAAA